MILKDFLIANFDKIQNLQELITYKLVIIMYEMMINDVLL